MRLLRSILRALVLTMTLSTILPTALRLLRLLASTLIVAWLII